MSIKDDILEALTVDVIPLLHDEVWPDVYEVIGLQQAANDSGGFSSAPVTVESGACCLKPANRLGAERAVADRLGYTSAYSVDLPLETVCTPAHTLTVNGRSLNVGEVIRGGEFAYKAVAICQEAG